MGLSVLAQACGCRIAAEDPCVKRGLRGMPCTGIYVEGLDAGDDDAQRVQRKWQKPIYTAAPTVVYRCLILHTPCDIPDLDMLMVS